MLGIEDNERMRDRKAMNLHGRTVLRLVISLTVAAAMMFLPAGSVRFWQGWVFMGVVLGPGWCFRSG